MPLGHDDIVVICSTVVTVVTILAGRRAARRDRQAKHDQIVATVHTAAELEHPTPPGPVTP